MNNTLSNGFRVLEYLAETGEMHSIKEMAERLGLPNSHVCRLLKTLKELGYVEQDSARKYRVGRRILRLSSVCLRKMGIRSRLRPFLARLAAELRSPVYLSVPEERRPLIVDVLYPPDYRGGDPGVDIGSVNPVHASASGKVVAAFVPEDELDDFLEKVEFTRMTEKTITSPKTFKRELEEVRRSRIAVTDSERGLGVHAAAAPVFDSGGRLVGVVGSFVASSSAGVTPERLDDFKDRIRSAAESCSLALGCAL